MKGDYLGAFEEIVLLAVATVGDEAYGVTVQQRVEEETGRAVSLGAVYATLERLQRKGHVKSWIGEAGPYRGGRRKRHFAISVDGRAALHDMRSIRERLWRTLDGAGSRKTP